MTMRWGFVAGCVLAAVLIAPRFAAAITMPEGSTVWMKFEATAGPDNDGDDVAGSNRVGVGNGIPLTSISNSFSTATGFAEILPGSIRTFLRSDFTSFIHASYQDTYTVTGTATGTFNIPVSLRVTGMMRSMPHPPFGHVINVATVQAEIGTFSPVTEQGGVPLNEGFRITPFDAASLAQHQIIGPDTRPSPFEVPIDITATYTVQNVKVGDTFVLGFGVNSSFAKAEIDLLSTGTVGFTLPEGVGLTSAMAQSIPEPGALAVLGLGVAATLIRRRPRRAC